MPAVRAPGPSTNYAGVASPEIGLIEQFDGDLLDDMSRAIEAAVQ